MIAAALRVVLEGRALYLALPWLNRALAGRRGHCSHDHPIGGSHHVPQARHQLSPRQQPGLRARASCRVGAAPARWQRAPRPFDDAAARARPDRSAARPGLQDLPRAGARRARADEAGAPHARGAAQPRQGRSLRRGPRAAARRHAGEGARRARGDARADDGSRARDPHPGAAAADGPGARAPPGMKALRYAVAVLALLVAGVAQAQVAGPPAWLQQLDLSQAQQDQLFEIFYRLAPVVREHLQASRRVYGLLTAEQRAQALKLPIRYE